MLSSRSVFAAVACMLMTSVEASRSHSETGLTQMVTYLKRHPGYTREGFWRYWQEQHAPKVVPLAAHFNITRYQQIQVGGFIPPTGGDASAPSSDNPVEFDGIAMFLYDSSETLADMLAHPYYADVVEPDEHEFIDKDAFGEGMVATFIGTHIEAVDGAEDVWVGDEITRQLYKEVFESYA